MWCSEFRSVTPSRSPIPGDARRASTDPIGWVRVGDGMHASVWRSEHHILVYNTQTSPGRSAHDVFLVAR